MLQETTAIFVSQLLILSLITKNGRFSSYSLLLGSIFLVGLISTPELPKCLFQSFFLVHSCSSSYMALGTSLCYALSAPALP